MTEIQNLDSLIVEKLFNYGKPMVFSQIFDGLVFQEALKIAEEKPTMGKWKLAYDLVGDRLQALRKANKIQFNFRWNRGWAVVQ